MKKSIVLLMFLFFIESLFCQEWIKVTQKDKWGDPVGYYYHQTVEGIGYDGIEKPMRIVLIYEIDESSIDIYCMTKNNETFRTTSMLNLETCKITCRADGKDVEFPGIVSRKNYSEVRVLWRVKLEFNDESIIPLSAVEFLRARKTYTILIEGRGWFIRATINGNLPVE
ncbi:hypothetical protein FACS1894110_15750 [Spirochaetia bacterium]|nr:hypothetical protein FACS1894110_15750 [Spirochaetia bacterium]